MNVAIETSPRTWREAQSRISRVFFNLFFYYGNSDMTSNCQWWCHCNIPDPNWSLSYLRNHVLFMVAWETNYHLDLKHYSRALEISAAVTWAIIFFHMCSFTVKLNACTHKSLFSNKNKHRCTQIKTSMIKKSFPLWLLWEWKKSCTNTLQSRQLIYNKCRKYTEKAFLLHPHLHSSSQPTHTDRTSTPTHSHTTRAAFTCSHQHRSDVTDKPADY